MRRFVINVCVSSVVVALAHAAFGHGVQIQITYNQSSGKIETREIVHTGSGPNVITDLTRVYIMPLLDTTLPAGNGWYTRPSDEVNAFNVPLYPTGPGITFQYDEAAQLPGTGWAYSGSGTLPNLQGTNFGYVFSDGLKSWNGTTWVDPGVEQMQVFRGEGTSVPTVTANTLDGGPFSAMALASIASKSTNAHSSIGHRMLGDGTNFGSGSPGAGDDGIYLLSLQLTSTALGVGTSDPFYYVMLKNTTLADGIDAAASLGVPMSQVQIVPEPTAAMALVFAGLLVLVGPFGGRAL